MSGDGAPVLVLVVVRGTCRYEGDLPPADRPELIVRKDDGRGGEEIRRGKIKEGAGGKLERRRREGQINHEDGGNELSRYSRVLNTIVHKSDNVAIQRRPRPGRLFSRAELAQAAR